MDNEPSSFFPPEAKRVYRGRIFDIWEWEQKLYDGTTATFEGLKRRHTVKAIATVGDKIMVTEEEQPAIGKYHSLPGGMLDDGKERLDQAKEELLSETGYASDDWEFWQSVQLFRGTDYAVHYFAARNAKKVGDPAPEAGERIGIRFLSFEEFLLLPEDPTFLGIELVNRLLRMRIHAKEREAFRAFLFKTA